MAQQSDRWTVESPQSLGAALRALREQRKWTQREMAERLGTTRQRIARMEEGDFSDQVLTLLRGLRHLGAVMELEAHDRS